MNKWLMRNVGLTLKQAVPWAITYISLLSLTTLVVADLTGLRWAIAIVWGGATAIVVGLAMWVWIDDRRLHRKWRRDIENSETRPKR